MLVNHSSLGRIEVSRIRSVSAESARRHGSEPGVVASFQRNGKLAGTCRLTTRNVSHCEFLTAMELRHLAELKDQNRQLELRFAE